MDDFEKLVNEESKNLYAQVNVSQEDAAILQSLFESEIFSGYRSRIEIPFDVLDEQTRNVLNGLIMAKALGIPFASWRPSIIPGAMSYERRFVPIIELTSDNSYSIFKYQLMELVAYSIENDHN